MDSSVILKTYRRAPNSVMEKLLLVVHRCREGCLLLHVWQSPAGPMYYRPRVPLADLNGLGRWGERGDRDLPAHAGYLSEFDISGATSGWGDESTAGVLFDAIVLGCGHCWGRYEAKLIVADATAASPGNPVVHNDIWGRAEPLTPRPRDRKRR